MAFLPPSSPTLHEAGPEALRGILQSDGTITDRALEKLGVAELWELQDAVQYLLETVGIAARTRTW